MLQAPMFDGLSLDPFALFDDGARPAEVGIGGCHIVQALVVALVIVMLDERLDRGRSLSSEMVKVRKPTALRLSQPLRR